MSDCPADWLVVLSIGAVLGAIGGILSIAYTALMQQGRAKKGVHVSISPLKRGAFITASAARVAHAQARLNQAHLRSP